MTFDLFIGYDPRLALAWNVCARSVVANAQLPPAMRPLGMSTLGELYGRPYKRAGGRLFDGLSSNAPMSTEFALARFYVPFVSKANWAVFCDGDFLFRADVARLLDEVDPRHAVSVVKHQHQPAENLKMDGQVQTGYPRKNWSSLMVWNLQHAGARRLSLLDLNAKPGLWLQQLAWLRDEEIGALDPAWNWLEGIGPSELEPRAVHFTRGTPDLAGHDAAEFADEWCAYLTEQESLRLCKPAAFVTA